MTWLEAFKKLFGLTLQKEKVRTWGQYAIKVIGVDIWRKPKELET